MKTKINKEKPKENKRKQKKTKQNTKKTKQNTKKIKHNTKNTKHNTNKLNLINGFKNINKNNIIEDNTNYIKKEILKMPKSIQNIIKIDNPIPKYINLKIIKTDYNKMINSIAMDNINILLNNKCINKPSLYNISTEVIIDDFILRKIPKGINIYKSFYGFYTESDILSYSEQNKNNVAWFGNKYICYVVAKENWGGVVSFKTTKDIFLLDFYNIHNIKKIIELLETIKETEFITKIKMFTGYNVSILDQFNYIKNNIYTKWDEFWIYTTSFYKKYSFYYNYCNLRVVNKLNPLGASFTKDDDYINLFKLIINKLPNIDGIIKDQLYSCINTLGRSDSEELIIKNSSLLKKLKFDYDDPLCWVNWKNKKLKYYKLKTYAHYSNKNFVLSEFYHINTLKLVPLNNYNLLSYNINSFINLHSNITYDSNINNIINLINYYKQNLNIISFQEMLFIDKKTFNYFYNKIKDKFPYYYNCINGASTVNTNITNNINVLSIYVFTNKKYKSQTLKLQLTLKDIIYINKKYNKLKNKIKNSINNTIFNFILLETEYGKIAFIHLDIGLLDVDTKNSNSQIKKYNSELRIIMLKKILVYKPDIISGDMNFTLDDEETNFLIKNNYYHQYNNNQNSTPYNRVDHCFISKELYNKNNKNKNNKIIENNKLLKCNYSDHLPMFQKL
jgi:hypothetical protein